MGVWQLQWQCYPHYQQNPQPCTDIVVLAGEGKKEYTKPCTKGRGVSYGKILLTTVAVTHDLHSGMHWFFKKKNSYLQN